MGKLKKKITNKKEIVLLTEVLPYETPIFFSNFGFYNYSVSNRINSPSFIKKIFFKRHFYIPYQFEIKRSEFKYRSLSLMHPIMQLRICDFYLNFENLILYNCNKSKFSLRRPKNTAQYIYLEENDTQFPIVSSKYFSYSPYNFLYEFFGSYEYNRLEKQYKRLLKLDISKFFPSIYTHSITWALKNKTFAKENINKYSFEDEFDSIMQSINHKETNGIIIGPEISRIFAEILLQKIDKSIEIELKKQNYIYGKHYKIKRYVDDYYVFVNDQDLLQLIQEIIEEKLEAYKLHLNDSKTEIHQAPFISSISIAKLDIGYMLNRYFAQFIKENEDHDQNKSYKLHANNIKKVRNSMSISMRGINEIKSTLDRSNASINDISRYILTIIENKLKQIFDLNVEYSLNEKQENNILEFIFIILDIIFYITSLDTVTKNTNSLISIITLIRKFYLKYSLDDLQQVEKRLYDELLLLFKTLNHKRKDNSIEAINILVSLRVLSTDFSLTNTQLDSMFNLHLNNASNIEVDYFKITGLLYYIRNNAKYELIRQKISKSIIDKFKNEKSPLDKSDLFCLFLDVVKCKYIKKETKLSLIDIIIEKEDFNNLNLSEKNRVINYICKYNWFTEWNTKITKLLKRKSLTIDY